MRSVNRQILIFENSFTLTNFLLKQWTKIVQEAVSERGRCVVALSGGKTPTEFYSRLSQFEEFDLWHKTHIFQADEHFVRFDDAENNLRIISENCLNFVPIPPENIHPIKTDHDNVLVSTEEYKHELVYFFDLKSRDLPRFDLVLLGCDINGEVASLHSGLEGVDDPDRLTIPITSSYYKTERISLTLPVINNARHIIFLIQGERKAEIVKRIVEDKENVIAHQVNAHDGHLSFLLDKEAASKLSSPSTFTDQGEAISI